MQYEQPASLPRADADSAAHSARVVEHISAKIRAAGGQISFAEFMHEALYAPGLGYYAAGATKFGAAGDFVTAPEISVVFGRIVARQVGEVLREVFVDTADGQILECGAGSGKLAVDMLAALEELDALPAAYNILEVSAELVERQRERLQAELPHLVERVRWLSALPGNFDGVIVANEVLDALAVERFVRRGEDVLQINVAIQGESFVLSEAVAPAALKSLVLEIEDGANLRFPDGYTSEVSLAASSWMADVSKSLRRGAAFLFDYGVSRREYYAPDRGDGWLRCHFRHHAHSDALILPGIQDITSWVDFSAVAGAAVSGGLEILGYQTQSQFLMGGGLAIEMERFADLPLAQQVELSGQVKTLTLPGEMGENFKCIAFGRGVKHVPSAFQFADRTHVL